MAHGKLSGQGRKDSTTFGGSCTDRACRGAGKEEKARPSLAAAAPIVRAEVRAENFPFSAGVYSAAQAGEHLFLVAAWKVLHI